MEFLNFDDKIPATEWFKLILPMMREGYQLKICPKGRSMIPFLVGGRDEAVLSVPADGYKFKKNDIVLFKNDVGMHILHRISRIDKKGIHTLGDGNIGIEGPFQPGEIIAVADYIIRKGKKIGRRYFPYLLLVTLWRGIRPLRPYVISAYIAIRGGGRRKAVK